MASKGSGPICRGGARVPLTAAALLAPLVLAGCAEEWGPEVMPTAGVSGVVHRSGSPVTTGWLEFLPVEGTVGRLRSAAIGPDGRFEAEGVAVGTVAIRVVGADLPRPEFTMLTQVYLIRRRVDPGGTRGLEIDLDRELRAVAEGRPG